MTRSREFATWNRDVRVVAGGKWVPSTEKIRVQVLARAEGYAMVRRRGDTPFVVPETQLCVKVVVRS